MLIVGGWWMLKDKNEVMWCGLARLGQVWPSVARFSQVWPGAEFQVPVCPLKAGLVTMKS